MAPDKLRRRVDGDGRAEIQRALAQRGGEVLSTARIVPGLRGALPIASRSATKSSGFEGDSIQIRSATAHMRTHAAVSSTATRCTSQRPCRAPLRQAGHPLVAVIGDRHHGSRRKLRDPAAAAAMPEAKATALPPSSPPLTMVSSASQVGVPAERVDPIAAQHVVGRKEGRHVQGRAGSGQRPAETIQDSGLISETDSVCSIVSAPPQLRHTPPLRRGQTASFEALSGNIRL